MTHHDVVLVGVDGSPASLEAADWAAAYAHAHGRALHLVCAYSVPSFTAAALDGGYAALDDTAIAEGARAVLDEAVARVSATGVRTTSAVAIGDAAAVLVELSRGASTVVVGQCACAGRAEETVPSRRSANPPRPRVPTTTVAAPRDSSTSTAAASPVATADVVRTPVALTRATASSSTARAPSAMAVSSSAAYPPSSAAAVNDGTEYAQTSAALPRGTTGVISSSQPISESSRSALWWLHREQAATTFVHSCTPPRDRGWMWSTVSAGAAQ